MIDIIYHKNIIKRVCPHSLEHKQLKLNALCWANIKLGLALTFFIPHQSLKVSTLPQYYLYKKLQSSVKSTSSF